MKIFVYRPTSEPMASTLQISMGYYGFRMRSAIMRAEDLTLTHCGQKFVSVGRGISDDVVRRAVSGKYR
jgi:hypothetical protein